MPIIQAQNLTKHYRVFQKSPGLYGALRGLFRRQYKDVRAVAGVSFEIEPGEMVAFLGPNGAGKTTTLKMLSGLIYPTSGSANVLGFVPWERPDAFRRQFSLVMGQKNQLWWDLPAADSFELHREIYSLRRDAFSRVLGQLTEMFAVGALMKQPVRELSLGERMKMELIAALLHEPRLLLLDEPTIGLDVVAQVAIQRCLKEYNAVRGVTMLLTSHYMRDVEALCSRVLVIAHGKLIHDGPLAGIIEKFGKHKLVRLQFLGESVPPDLGQYGEHTAVGPVAELKLDREKVAGVLASILDRYTVIDVSVQDPPLDQLIARVFEEGRAVSKLVIGCGYLGLRVAHLWRDAGERVFVTSRKPERRAQLAAEGFAPVAFDALSPSALPEVDAAVYCVAMRGGAVEGLANTLAALPGRPRLVYVSSTSVYGQRNGEVVDEDSDTAPTDEAGRVALGAERLLRQQRPDAAVLRFAGIYGPGRLLREAAVRAGEPIAADPDAWLNLIHVEDGARIVCAMAASAAEMVYNVSDDHPVLRRDFYDRLATLLGAPRPCFCTTPEAVNRRVSAARLRRELGVPPRYPSYEQGLAASVSPGP